MPAPRASASELRKVDARLRGATARRRTVVMFDGTCRVAKPVEPFVPVMEEPGDVFG